MKPRERRGLYEGGGDGVQGEDIVRQTTSRHRAQGHGTMEEEDKARNERKNGQERGKPLVGWVFILRRGTQLFHGCRLGCRWKQRQDAANPPALIEKGAPPFTIQEFATRAILPAIYSLFLAITVILLSRPRISLHLCSFCSSA